MVAVVRERVAVPGGSLSVLACGDGAPLVLLHGIPTSAELWRGVLAPLATAGYRVIAPDLPGYGKTRMSPSTDHSLAGAATVVASWLEAAAGEPAWVVGHDAGGAVAQLLAVHHSQTVARLSLVNSIVDGSWPAPRARIATWAARAGLYRAAAGLRLLPNPYLRWQLRRGLADRRRTVRADVDRVVCDGKFSDAAGRAAFERHLAALSPVDTAVVAPALAEVPVPCQLVWGMADVFQPWETAGRRLAALLPGADVTRLDACGHFVPLECPERLVLALLAFGRS